jgi:hypothetical protein
MNMNDPPKYDQYEQWMTPEEFVAAKVNQAKQATMDQQLRIEALRAASRLATFAYPSEIIARAKEFEEYLRGTA